MQTSDPTGRKNLMVDALEAAGLDEAGRHRFHRALEGRDPAFHEAFLEFLGVAPDDRREIAAWSRDTTTGAK